MTIRYQPLRAGEGLALADGTLSAHHNGQVVAQATAPAGADLGRLMDGYRLLRLLPDLTFSHVAPTTDDYTIDVTDATVTPNDMSGVLSVAGERHPWDAMLVVDDIFTDRSMYGPWLGNEMAERSVRGWAYRIPGALVYNDPVLATRMRLAIQGVVCSLIAARPIELPATFRLTNQFGLANPPVPPAVAPDVDTLRASRHDGATIARITRAQPMPDAPA